MEDEDEENPEEILRMRLLEYQRFKDAAFEISSGMCSGGTFSPVLTENLFRIKAKQI